MTDDDKRLLTEFLGDCWHTDFHELIYARPYFYCERCQERDPQRLDFDDWRVVGRLVEKVKRPMRLQYCFEGQVGACFVGGVGVIWADTETAAICAAVLSYLKARGQ
jgi:hypothetical protein